MIKVPGPKIQLPGPLITRAPAKIPFETIFGLSSLGGRSTLSTKIKKSVIPLKRTQQVILKSMFAY